MSLITDILPISNIFLDQEITSKKRLFEQAGLHFENTKGIARSATFDALIARERMGSTALGQSVAIPHGRVAGLKTAVACLFRMAQPIPFEAPDGKPVALAVVLLVPEQANELHLRILSELAQRFSDRKIREGLLAATDSAALHALLD
ncbi:PTS sugar transporter subunit IIA [Burkholderiaceae bacterium DAT-1]|nr:PTS sugar transporter subunit IIA [Burkholderiaceae bacterium DAT-1]